MPTYEYVCRACDEGIEVVQSFSDDPLKVCPACGGELRKVFGNVGISFKGAGFYRNDSRAASSTKKASESKSKTESTTSGSGAETSSNGATTTAAPAPQTSSSTPS